MMLLKPSASCHCTLTKKSLQKNLDLVSSCLMWLVAYTFIDKHADFPDGTGGDARRDLYEEWLGLAEDCIHSHRQRFIFALFRFRECIMIGYSWNRSGLLASIRECVKYIGKFLPEKECECCCCQQKHSTKETL